MVRKQTRFCRGIRQGTALLRTGNPDQSILDLGCGTGTLTHTLLEKSASVTGLDSSPEMIAKARQLYPGMDFRVLDARLMPWRNRFDIVFSNAAFHWIPDHGTLLNAVSRVLKPQGKLVCEFGARLNILRIREAFRTALERRNLPYTTRFTFPPRKNTAAFWNKPGSARKQWRNLTALRR